VLRSTVSSSDIGEGVSALKIVRISPRHRRRVTTTFASLVSLTLSQVEVAVAFHLPLNRFTDPRYLREHQFCVSIPYCACDVADLVAPGIEWSNEGGDSGGEVGGRFGGRLEIWGLTGWYPSLFMKIFFGGRCQ